MSAASGIYGDLPQRLLIRVLVYGTLLRELRLSSVAAALASDRNKNFVTHFRFTTGGRIGRYTYFGSVEGLQISFGTGRLLGGAREAQTGRIL
jgi:hypothetical protein